MRVPLFSSSTEPHGLQIVLADKEVQFHLGHDDTALENLMRRLRSASGGTSSGQDAKGQERDSSSGQTLTEEDAAGSTTTFKGLHRSRSEARGGNPRFSDTAGWPMHHARNPKFGDGGGGAGGGTAASSRPTLPPRPQRLGKFLRQACVVMETLCEENLLSERAGDGRRNDPGEDSDDDDDEWSSLFPKEAVGAGWEEVGSGVAAEATDGRAALGGAPSSTESAAAGSGEGGEGKVEGSNGTSKAKAGFGFRSLLEGADVAGVAFSRVKRSMLVTAHARSAQPREDRSGLVAGQGVHKESATVLEGCGVVCVWNAENVTVRDR